jgi:hypothetical protein
LLQVVEVVKVDKVVGLVAPAVEQAGEMVVLVLHVEEVGVLMAWEAQKLPVRINILLLPEELAVEELDPTVAVIAVVAAEEEDMVAAAVAEILREETVRVAAAEAAAGT